MNAVPDVERLITDWLVQEAPARAPDRILLVSHDRIEQTSQRSRRLTLRFPTMITPVRAGMAAVIGVLLLGAGIYIYGGLPPDIGARPTPTTSATPSPLPTMAQAVWPQSSLADVEEAQRLADAGDPAYSWQVEPILESDLGKAEIITRFVREELGWAGFIVHPFAAYLADGLSAPDAFTGLDLLRCAADRTNPLYPDGAFTPPDGNDHNPGNCAPTIDDFTYEAVRLDVTRLVRPGPSGIWVVTGWAEAAPFAQLAPPVDDAEALLREFLQARIAGQGAEALVDIQHEWAREVPLLYATSTGAPYERYEFERVGGPDWPYGDMEYKVRLFAEGEKTVLEQRIAARNEGGRRLRLNVGDAWTTENGIPVAVPYGFLDGVIVRAAPPWHDPDGTMRLGLSMDGQAREERLQMIADPAPVERGCEPTTPAGVEALARSIGADADLEATAPVAVSIGGIEGVWMDVTAAPAAFVCSPAEYPYIPVLSGERSGASLVAGSRMRLYLLDAPEGSSMQVLAIAITAPEARFEELVEAAAPVVDSLEFYAP